MNLETVKISNFQYRGGRTFRYRARITDRNGKKVNFERKVVIPNDYNTVNKVKTFLETKKAKFINEQGNYFNQSERKLKDIIAEYLEQASSSVSNAMDNKNEYETGKRMLSIKTYETYKDYAPRITAALGDIKIKDLTAVHIEKFKIALSKSGIRNDALFLATEKLLENFENIKMSNNQLSKEIPINRHSLVNLRLGKGVSLKTANNVSNFFGSKFEDLFTEKISQKGLSAKTINNYCAFISSVFEWAKKARYIKDNPCENVKKFRVCKTERKSIANEEMKIFFKSLEDNDDLEFLLQNYILAFTGCRRGEMLGLRFNSFDSKQGTLTFKESVLYEKEVGCYISTLKNSEMRTIKISNQLCEIIEKYKNTKKNDYDKLGIKFDDSLMMFTNKTGGYLHPDTFCERLRKFKTKYGLKNSEIKPLKLRHNYATQLLEQGESPYAVAKDMGHYSPTTTFNFYADAIEIGKRKNLSQSLYSLYK